MRLIKDLLLFDIQTTGPDPEKDSILQLSAVLLDKDNMLEKAVFNQYARISILDSVLAGHANLLGLDPVSYKKTPRQIDVFKEFLNKFGDNVTLASLHIGNVIFLRQNLNKHSLPFPFDPHIIDIWTLGYIYSMHLGIKKMPTLHTLAEIFNIKQESFNNAMHKVQVELAILRNLTTQI